MQRIWGFCRARLVCDRVRNVLTALGTAPKGTAWGGGGKSRDWGAGLGAELHPWLLAAVPAQRRALGPGLPADCTAALLQAALVPDGAGHRQLRDVPGLRLHHLQVRGSAAAPGKFLHSFPPPSLGAALPVRSRSASLSPRTGRGTVVRCHQGPRAVPVQGDPGAPPAPPLCTGSTRR